MESSDSIERRIRTRKTGPYADFTPSRRVSGAGDVRRVPSNHNHSSGLRECVPLRDLTDCLLQAYDCIARRYEKSLSRGPHPGSDIDDWLAAERELLPSIPVSIENAKNFIYALAVVPRATKWISVAVESRWLVILSHVPPDPHRDGFRESIDDNSAYHLPGNRRQSPPRHRKASNISNDRFLPGTGTTQNPTEVICRRPRPWFPPDQTTHRRRK